MDLLADAAHELQEISLANNKFLCGLAARFGAEPVEAACMAVLGYPATLVTTMPEASEVLSYLENQGNGV